MRDAARHVRPGGSSLRNSELGDVVEGQNNAVIGIWSSCSRVTCTAKFRSPLSRTMRHLALYRLAALLARFLDDFAEFGHRNFQGLPDQLFFWQPQKLASGAVDQRHASQRVETYNASRYAGQHRLDEAAALIEFRVRAHNVIVLGLKIDRHLLEGRSEPANVVASRAVSSCTLRLPWLTSCAAPISLRIGVTKRFANTRPVQIAEVSSVRARSTYISEKTNV